MCSFSKTAMPFKLARSCKRSDGGFADARRAAGGSQMTLAHTIGLEHSAISKMESG
jgi:DNA-binding XRE family transcriptional regulator